MLSLSNVNSAGSWQQGSDRVLPQLRQNASTTCEANFGEEKCCIARSSVSFPGRASCQFFSGQSLGRRTASLRRRPRARGVTVCADADYYSTLGVSKSADKAEIKSSYRRMARKFHPDVNKEAGAEQRFKDISNAYEVLSDDEKRSIYDRFGEAGLKGAGQGAGPGDFSSPFDLFETFFGGNMGGGGGRASRNRPVQGEDERYDLPVEFTQAVFGVDTEVEVSRLESCDTCSGSGAKPGTSPTTCSTCGGQGQVVNTTRTPLGSFQAIAPCAACSGTGDMSPKCQKCNGEGRVNRNKRVTLKVPPGVDDGNRLRVKGEGSAGRRGGPPGDLYVFLNVKPHPELRREGNNILFQVKVSYLDAILGSTVTVPTVDGNCQLKVPAGIQPSATLVMAKRGVPFLGKSYVRGDQMVRVNVEIPKKLSEEERDLIQQLSELNEKKANAVAAL